MFGFWCNIGASVGEWVESHRSLIEPHDCDFNNHMNVMGYFSRFCNAGGYLLAQAGASHGEAIELGLGVGTISNTIRYFEEVVHTDQVMINSAVFKIGRSSIHHGHRLMNVKSGALSATCIFSEVLFGLESRASTPWPADIRARLEDRVIELNDDQRAEYGSVYP